MQIIYEGVDIAGDVMARSCVVNEGFGPACDSVMAEFDNAGRWMQWEPQENDHVRFIRDGYDSGTMYLDSCSVRDGYTFMCFTSLPPTARVKEWKSYVGMTVGEIFHSCARRTGMGSGLYGMDGDAVIPYIEQEYETAAKFLHRLSALEGALFKCVDGKYAGIDIGYAGWRDAIQTIELRYDTPGACWIREGGKLRALTVEGPNGAATAMDAGTRTGAPWEVCSKHPPGDSMAAGRWARGLLKHRNREAESISISSEFNPGLSTGARIDVIGESGMTGEWIVDSARHDLVYGTSSAVLKRSSFMIA